MRLLSTLMSVIMLNACATHQPETINGLIIKNQTNFAVKDVVLKIPETGGIVSCSMILPHTECSMGFQERALGDNLAILSWKQDHKKYNVPLSNDQSPAVHPDYPYHAVVKIMDDGQLNVNLD